MTMNETVQCIRCHAHMESGWVPDNNHGGLQRQNWSPGEPQPSFWMGLKVEKKDQVIPVTTLRCPNCGYLESYAMPPETAREIRRTSTVRQAALGDDPSQFVCGEDSGLC